MRARNLKPGFFKNEDLATIDPLGRILFEGLWCMADRKGKLEDRPQRIKVEILPYDNCDIEQLLDALNNKHFINRYSVSGSNFIEILNFLKHQTPHWQERDSILPSPDSPKKKLRVIQNKSKCNPSVIHLTPDSLLLTPDSLLLDTNGMGFDLFWKAYPKKIGIGAARKAWGKIKPSETLLGKILKKIEIEKNTEQWIKDHGQYIPHPTTWLNQERWEDEVEVMEDPYKDFERIGENNGQEN